VYYSYENYVTVAEDVTSDVASVEKLVVWLIGFEALSCPG